MNYSELTVKERIQHAAQYAVILKDDPLKTQDEVIAELSTTFYLTTEEATAAFHSSKQQFASAYNAAKKDKAWHNGILIVGFTLAGLMYFFLSTESGFGFVGIFAALFFLGSISIAGIVIKNFIESRSPEGLPFNLPKKNFFVQIFPMMALFFLFAFYNMQFGNIVTKDQVTVLPFRLTEKITMRETGGKNSQKYYHFKFENYQKPFRFLSSDYRYASPLPALLTYRAGDTVYAELLKEDIKDLNSSTVFSKNNRIISLQLNNRSIVDYNSRYQSIKASKKRLFQVLLIVFVINMLCLAGISKFGKKPDT